MKKGNKKSAKERLDATLRFTYWQEGSQVRQDLREGVISGYRDRGLEQYHLRQQDSAGFIYSSPQARIQYAVESGLIPSTDL